MKILLVDDDDFLRDMYATKFGENGHSIEAVSTGEDAVLKLGEESFDVVLMDMIMPGMSGVDLLKRIEQENFKKKPVCIVLSNQGSEMEMSSAKEAGAKGYIIKAELIPSEVVEEVENLVK